MVYSIFHGKCKKFSRTTKSDNKMQIYQITSEILKELSAAVKPGITTQSLEDLAEKLLEKYKVQSYNKGYHPKWSKEPYPAILCINVNSIICHGIPSNYKLQEGDICSIDLGIKKDGVCGDAALTVPVGEISNANERLIRYAKQTVYEVLKMIKPGANTEDIARHTESFAKLRGYNLNKRFSGHTIGEEMHMKPSIYSTVEEPHEYADLVEGQTICIEPMLTSGADAYGVMLSNNWTYVTRDRKNSAVFEHMVLVTKDGYKVLTDHFSDPRGGDKNGDEKQKADESKKD